jgi:hypothetical protein
MSSMLLESEHFSHDVGTRTEANLLLFVRILIMIKS